MLINDGGAAKICVKKGICDVCSFGCLMDCYVDRGRLVRVAPDRESKTARGHLCAKGYSNRQYIYSSDRLTAPLRRVGERGQGWFEEISWQEAYDEIALRLGAIKERFGAESVAFYSGYTKWYRPMLHRLAFDFGTPNYGSESSSCFQATIVAEACASGTMSSPDMDGAGVMLAWGFNTFYSNLPFPSADGPKARGMKIIVVDPKITPASQRYADIHLRPRPGTDGALAHGIARLLIHGGGIDEEFIRAHVAGYDDYARMVEEFTPARVEELTGVPARQLEEAGALILSNAPLAVQEGNAGIIHHANGVSNYRAINALIAITGGFAKAGGNHSHKAVDPTGSVIFPEAEFIDEARPKNVRPKVGSDEYPIWSRVIDEFQVMLLPEYADPKREYGLRAMVAFGMNARMFPESGKYFDALKKLDFFVDVDIFATDSAKYADIVLPACTSLERAELRSAGRVALWREPVIAPLYDSRSDGDIICQLASALGLDDPILTGGYESFCRHMLRRLPFTLEELKERGEIAAPSAPKEDKPLFYTPSGKYELASSLLSEYPGRGYDVLPIYRDPLDGADSEEFPMILCSGGRLPGAFASRFHRVPWARSLRPQAMVDINPRDAARLGIAQGEAVTLTTSAGSLKVPANVTVAVLEGVVTQYHGYSEADVNTLIPKEHRDPYSGYPGYRSTRCRVERGPQDV